MSAMRRRAMLVSPEQMDVVRTVRARARRGLVTVEDDLSPDEELIARQLELWGVTRFWREAGPEGAARVRVTISRRWIITDDPERQDEINGPCHDMDPAEIEFVFDAGREQQC